MNRHITTKLDCGATLIVEPMSGVRSAAMTWLLPAGAACDPADRQGMATMWSELVLRGAGAFNSRQHADALDRMGINRSAESGVLTFRIGMTCVGERFTESVPLITPMVLSPRMEAEAVEPARDLALQSLESLADDPQERVMLLARERHFPDPINRSGMGDVPGLKALTRDELVQGWRRHALPVGSIIACAGHIDPAQVEETFNRELANWKGIAPAFGRGPAAPRGYAHEEDDTAQVQVIVVFDAPSEPHADSILEKIAVTVLSGGMSGRLFTEVREKRGLCYAVSAGYRGDIDHGAVTAYVGTTPERAQDSLTVLLEQLQRTATPEGRITKDEFDRAVIGMKSSLIFSGESTSARAAALAADQRRLGRPRSLEEIAGQIDAVTLDQLNDYLARRPLGRITIQTLGPKPLTPPEMS